MTKAKVVAKNSKNHLKHPKDGSIHKKKQQKFKNTPNGKVPMINGTPSKMNAKQISPKNGNGVMKSAKSPKSPKAQNGGANSKKGGKTSPKAKKEEEDDEDSEEDFNEGISISEIVSGQEDDDDDDSSDDDALPDVLTTTLPDVTDESDGDFDVTTAENKGVKMFRGVNTPNDEAEESDDDDDDDDEEEDDEDDEEDEHEGKSALGLSALLGDSIKDESGDEDFVGMETSEDDEDDEDDDDEEDDSDEEVPDQSLNSSNITCTDEDEEEDDDEDEEDDDDDDDDSSPNLTDLLGTSLVDESDDNDFEADDDDADEDEDISSEEDDEETPKSKKTKETESASLSPQEKAQLKSEHDKRTIFVGNIPKDTKVQVLTREFKKFGPIETVRLRGIIPGDPNMSLKVAAIKKNFHEKSTNICAFIRYQNEESVTKALAMNGKKFEGNYLRVDRSERPRASDKKKAVFLGNLPFTVEDNELWDAFKDCGKIESVRIIRHRATGLGRGFGYINFETSEGAVLALSLNGSEINNRKIRVQPVSGQDSAKKKERQQQKEAPEKGGKRKHQSESESNHSPKKVKTDSSESVERATHNSVNAERRTKKGKKRSQGDKQRSKSNSSSPAKSDSSPTKFQGQTGASKNKKAKQDKTSKKKKQMAAKLLAKPKKPSAN